MATHSSILAWEIPWTEEPGGLQFKESQRVRHDWATKHKCLECTKPCTHFIAGWFSTFNSNNKTRVDFVNTHILWRKKLGSRKVKFPRVTQLERGQGHSLHTGILILEPTPFTAIVNTVTQVMSGMTMLSICYTFHRI